MKWIHQLTSRQIRFIGVMIAAILLISIRFFWPIIFSGYTQPKAVKGVIDLQQWDFQHKGNVKLRGEWTFVPNQFIPPFPLHAWLPEAKFVKTPHLWNAYFDSKKPSALGYATYRLNILLPEKSSNTSSNPVTYAFHVTNIRSSYTLFVNGAALGSRGQPGKDKASYKPDNYPYIAFVNITGNEAEVILHVANFDYQIGGGILIPIELGTPSQITTSKKYAEMSDTAIFVLMVLLAIFSGFLYSYQSKQTHLLYFTLFFLSLALYIVTNSERILIALSGLPYNVYSMLQLLSIAGIIYFSYMFIIRMYPELSWTIPLWIVRMICGGFSCLFLFAKLSFYSFLLPYWFYFLEVMIACMLAMLLKAVWNHKDDALYLFLGALALLCHGIPFIMLIYDVILPEVPPIDLIVFALSLMLLVTHRFVETMGQVESLTLQQVRMEMAFMQAQIKPHFLFNSLNTIGSFIETEPYRAQDLLGEFSTYLRSGFDLTSLEPTVPFDREWTLVEAYLKLEQARYGEALNIYIDIAAARGVRLPPLSLQPLVENAVRHGVMMRVEGGSIRITAQAIENEVELSVADTGIGISHDRLASLLDNTSSDKSALTSNGNGIGLKNIQHRLIHTYGKGLLISSTLQQGTLITFRIPKEAAQEDDLKNTIG